MFRRKSVKIWLMATTISILVALLLAVTGCGKSTSEQPKATGGGSPTGEQSKEPIKLGVILSLTGPASTFGTVEKLGAELAAEKINASGGINGRPIELVIEDDKTDATTAVQAANKLIFEDKVVGIVGTTLGGSTLAFAPVAAKAETPVISVAGTVKVTDPESEWFRWTFRTPAQDKVVAESMLQFIQGTLKAKDIAIIHQSDAYGTQGTEELVKLAPKYNLNVKIVEKFVITDTNMTGQLTKIRAANPDAIIMWVSGGNAAATLLRNRQELGIKVPTVGPLGLAQQAIVDAAGPAANGMIVASMISADRLLPNQKWLADAVLKKTGKPVGPFAELVAADAVLIFAEAIKTAGTDRAKIRDAIEEIKNFEASAAEKYSFSSQNHDGVGPGSVVWLKVENGKFTSYQ